MKFSYLIFSYFLSFIFFNSTCYAQTQDGGTHEKWEYALEGTGDVLQLALPVAAGITTIVKKDWQGTKQFALSYGTCFLATHILKKVVHKERPEDRNLYDAFPSGHTSSAFSGASFIQRRYGWKYGKWAYVLAAIVGVSRMEGPDGWHDIWDVLGGAAIGIGSTYIFTKPFKQNNLSWNFNSSKDFFVLSFCYKF